MTKKNTPAKAELINAMRGVLADTYVLAVKAHGYHWNVTGEDFLEYHEFFAKQYEEMFGAADDIAERMRALDVAAPQSMKQFLDLTSLKEAPVKPAGYRAMLADILASHKQVAQRLHDAIEIADAVDDDGTEDLFIGRLRAHDKTIWMLNSILAK